MDLINKLKAVCKTKNQAKAIESIAETLETLGRPELLQFIGCYMVAVSSRLLPSSSNGIRTTNKANDEIKNILAGLVRPIPRKNSKDMAKGINLLHDFNSGIRNKNRREGLSSWASGLDSSGSGKSYRSSKEAKELNKLVAREFKTKHNDNIGRSKKFPLWSIIQENGEDLEAIEKQIRKMTRSLLGNYVFDDVNFEFNKLLKITK